MQEVWTGAWDALFLISSEGMLLSLVRMPFYDSNLLDYSRTWSLCLLNWPCFYWCCSSLLFNAVVKQVDPADSCFDSNLSPLPHSLGYRHPSCWAVVGFKQSKVNEVFRTLSDACWGQGTRLVFLFAPSKPFDSSLYKPFVPSLLPQLLSPPLGLVQTLPEPPGSSCFLYPNPFLKIAGVLTSSMQPSWLTLLPVGLIKTSTSPSSYKTTCWTFCNWCLLCISIWKTHLHELFWAGGKTLGRFE